MSNYSAWDVKTTDFPHEAELSKKIAFACRYGILAPSVHNTQPWRFEVTGNTLRVTLAAERLLDAGDPTKRESWISIGAAVENITLAAEMLGLSLQESKHDQSLIDYQFALAEPQPHLGALVDAIPRRASQRGAYTNTVIAEDVLKELDAIKLPGTQVVATNDAHLIEMIADLTGRAIGMALGNPAFRGELSGLVRNSWTKQPTGMPAFSLGVSPARGLIEHKLVQSGALIDAQSRKEREALRKSGGIVLVFSEGDTLPYWVNAGRAYQRAALLATTHGLGTSTTAAVVEAADYHLDIERYMKSRGRLQSVMRIGHLEPGSAAGHSPRLALEQVLTFSS